MFINSHKTLAERKTHSSEKIQHKFGWVLSGVQVKIDWEFSHIVVVSVGQLCWVSWVWYGAKKNINWGNECFFCYFSLSERRFSLIARRVRGFFGKFLRFHSVERVRRDCTEKIIWNSRDLWVISSSVLSTLHFSQIITKNRFKSIRTDSANWSLPLLSIIHANWFHPV